MTRLAFALPLLATLAGSSPALGQQLSPDSARALNHQMVRKECDEGLGRSIFDCDRMMVSYLAAEDRLQRQALATMQASLDQLCSRASSPQPRDTVDMRRIADRYPGMPGTACDAARWFTANRSAEDFVQPTSFVQMAISRELSYRDPAKIRAQKLQECDAERNDCACFADVHVTMLTDSIAKRELSSQTSMEVLTQALTRCRKP